MRKNLSSYIDTRLIEKVELFAQKEKRTKSNAVERLLEIAFRTITENK